MSTEHDWRLVYDASVAARLSNTFGSSDHSAGVQIALGCKGASGIVYRLSGLTLVAATKVRITPAIVDGTDPTAWTKTYPPNSSGSSPRFKSLGAEGYETPPFPLSAEFITVEPWLDAADAAAVCSIYARLLY